MKQLFNIIRVGKQFTLTNYGEVYDFEVVRILPNGKIEVKDLHTLENYLLDDLLKFGKGKDYSLIEK
ncbi:hypothetical protein QWY31_15335 [Cytophagales bacterium LB-30]|uniref:Phage protein n=1 Tax=Shiella aurantiaca TaxID=3058365 RepID=A0ABT8F9G0_9BACT|nr:hypothetical protein [Shiella aurantiaca]MDN4166884.1 hypothetical protein [Shiella aurantiaca]